MFVYGGYEREGEEEEEAMQGKPERNSTNERKWKQMKTLKI